MLLSAVIFFAVSIPFKQLFSLIPGVTEIRPANMIPPVLGLLFGPAAAWGISIGNLISDALSGSSVFICAAGFITNFFFAYIPYKLWYTLSFGEEWITTPSLNTLKGILKYIYIILIDSLVTTVLLTFIFEAAGFQAVASSAFLLFLNNFDFAILLGIPTLIVLSNTKLQPMLPRKTKDFAWKKLFNGMFDFLLYAIILIGLGYLGYSVLSFGQMNSEFTKKVFFGMCIGLIFFAMKPIAGEIGHAKKSAQIRVSIKAKVTIGFLLIAAVCVAFIGVIAYQSMQNRSDAEFLQIWDYIYTVLGMAINIIFAITLLFLWYVEKNITTPIETLAKIAKQFSKKNHQELGAEADLFLECKKIKTADEIEALAESFQKMMMDITTSVKNLAIVTADKERIATELNVATQIQASMLPCIFPPFPELDDFDIFANMHPAKEVGGDFYDFFLIGENRVGVVIADVSGKGVPAALFMVIAKTLIKNHAQNGKSPEEVFTEVNHQLCENNDAGMFVTAFMGILELKDGTFTYVNAGHNAPLLYRRNRTFEWLKVRPGFVLAGMEEVQYQQDKLVLLPGDRLFLYTDGVTEALNTRKELFGDERLYRLLNRESVTQLGLKELVLYVKQEIEQFSEGEMQADDITVLVLQLGKKP